MGNPGLCRVRWFLSRLYRVVFAAAPLPHGRGSTLCVADDANWPSHRGYRFGRENVRRAIAGGGSSVAGPCHRQWLSHAEAETGLALLALLVLFQAWHDFHEVAGRMTVIQLVFQDFIPGIPAGPGRTRQAEDIFSLHNASRGTRL